MLTSVADVLSTSGVEAYLCGGFVRDALLGLPTRDIDVCANGDPLALGPELAVAVGGTFFPLDAERRHARVIVREPPVYVDVTPMRGTIEEDLRQRDFTIDALAVPLGDADDVIDPTGGLADLDARLVRCLAEQVFLDDPLRLLRGARIATAVGFEIDGETAGFIRKHAGRLAEAAAERQRDELVRIFDSDRAANGVRLLDDLGLLSVVMPEIDVTRGVTQPPNHHYYDVFGHGIATVEALDILMTRSDEGPDPLGIRRETQMGIEWWPQARAYFDEAMPSGGTRMAVLKLCGLLHDIAKPQTKTIDPDGRIRFNGHSDQGAEIAGKLMRRLRYPSREVRIVERMIGAHLRPMELARERAPSRRAVYKFFRDTEDAAIDTLVLSLADHAGSQGPELGMDGWRRHLAIVNYIVAVRYTEPEIVRPPKFVDGDDLMAEFGLAPGPLLGELLDAVHEAAAVGEARTREDALEVARDALARVNKRQPA